MTKENLADILTNPEFTACINEAAPYRVKIIQDYSPRMKELQEQFLELLEKVDFNRVSDIKAKLKLDKNDDAAKGLYIKWKKKGTNIFKATLKTIHPNENQIPSIGMLYTAGSLLKYIDKEYLILENENYDRDNPLIFKNLEDLNPAFNNEDIRAQMKQIFIDADECQGNICNSADQIKIFIFNKLPDSIKFYPKTNKKGLKASDFQKLVRHKAMGLIKDKDKYTQYINTQVENSYNNIDREEVILGKTEQM